VSAGIVRLAPRLVLGLMLVLPAPRLGAPGASVSAAAPGALAARILEADPRPGDLIFRRGTSVASRLVLATDRAASYSHVGIVVDRPGSLGVVHAVPASDDEPKGGVVQVPLAAFLAPDAAVAAALLRPRGRDLRFGLLESQEELYCTELVWVVYRHEGLDLAQDLPARPRSPMRAASYLLPSRIQENPLLTTLCRAELGEV